MAKAKTTFSKRFLAVVLSVLMVFTALPFSMTTALAATEQHPDAVTITVKDENGEPLEGADVTFTIDSVINGDEWKKGTEKTDSDGCVEVLPKADFVADDMTITASVSKDKFATNDTAIVDLAIDADNQNFDVELISTTINDVTIEGKTLTYNGNEQELVSVTEIAGDTVEYASLEGKFTLNDNGKPVAINAGTYKIEVTVSRDGKEKLVKTVTSTIEAANIEVDFNAKNPGYNEKAQELVSVTGAENIPAGSTVKWYLNSEEYSSAISDVPQATAVGEYKVELIIEGNSNYKKVDIQKTVNIVEGELNLDGLTVDGLNSVYKVDENGDPVAQKAVKVTPESGHSYTLKYQLDDGDLAVNDTAWEEEIPTVTNAGSYIVWVKAVKEGYKDSDVPVNPAAGAVAPYNVYIAKADQTFEFDNYTNGETTTEQTSDVAPYVGKTYQFKATDSANLANGTITYSVELNEEDADIATIDNEGVLTVSYPGVITVVATLSGNDNYNECVIKHTLEITTVVGKQGDWVKFDKESVEDYIFGTNDGTVSENAAKSVVAKDKGKITYSIENGAEYGLAVNKNGKVTITDYARLDEALRESSGTLRVKVKADKAEVKNFWGTKTKYPADFATYVLTVKYLPTPQDPYVVKEEANEKDWYNTAITVSAKDSAVYEIAKECNPKAFGESVSCDNQGTGERYVYLRDSATGGITNRILLEGVQIDTIAPEAKNMKIEIQKLNIIEKLGVKFGFYNPSVDIKFIVDDETGTEESGMDYIEWFYTKEPTATSSIRAEKSGILPVTSEDDKYVATLTLTATEAEQYRGHIAFEACDIAGNRSARVTEDNVAIVIDTINPMMSAKFQVADTENGVYETDIVNGVTQHYFNGSVDFTFTIDEANFFSDDVVINVTKDGKLHKVDVVWTNDSEDDEIHYGKFTLNGDGDYVVSMSYKDQSKNVMKDADKNEEIAEYKSEVITIDETKPVVDFAFDQANQKTVFTVVEHNFRPEDIVVTGTIKDINDNDVVGITADDITKALHEGKWTRKGDTYTFETDQYKNGIYDLTINYEDISGNKAETKEPETFIIDHDAPTDVSIEYTKSILDTVLETVTLGFYNPDVKVTFTAFDTSAGVESFTWNYTKQNGQSNVNRPTDDAEKIKNQVIPAVQDGKDKSKFTAEVTLTATEAEQLRGYISVLATDAYKNVSDKVTDEGYVLVVDTISPTMTVEYSKEARMVGSTAYYNGDATVTFTVNEANFFAEDVKVTVTKDGGAPYAITPSWTDESVDVHVGTYTFSDDGDYVIHVEYTDRSTNEMKSYTSNTITIDTIAPVIDVKYTNEKCTDTLKDNEGNKRKYFDDTQTAVVTITEHNFNADEVDFSIISKDVTGKELNANALNEKSAWRVDSTGDVHTITITYPGDANYTFDVDYTDLATNKAEDYAPDYFTVDKTDPKNLTVSYSTSVLDTVLESLTFGFYNAKMTVTITADDITSGVHSFMYSYLNAAGVSGVNAELVNELIEAADIKYSNDGKTATASFEIPKKVLGADNQFNGTVEFTATDRSKNKTEIKDSKRIVVDNIAPTAQVSYNEATNVVGDISYYNGDINATVTINEANFYANDVQVMVSKDGGAASAVSPVWEDNSVDVHTGKFTLTGDGDYIVTINYKDKSSNEMTAYTSKQMTIDTDIKAPTYSINGVAKTEEGGAYKGDATIAFNYEDQNFDTQNIKLTRTRFDSVEDVTNEFIKVSGSDKGGSGSFTIPSEVKNDGIYLLTIGITDKANHTTESHMKFTINRYGSVYEYSDYLASLIKDGGQYIKIEGNNKTAITQDLVITEYNANQIIEDSLKILITRDGQTIDAKYTTNPAINGDAGIGESGWYQYVYAIDQENFAEDGVYKITLASEYAASDSEKNESTSVPDNSLDAAGNQILDTINFTVDTTAPEIRNVVNLDKAIVNAQTLDVDYTIVDVGGLKSIEVIVNGSPLDTITEFGDSAFNYSGKFTLNESSDAQTVQIRVTDIAGNVTDTASDDFSTGGLYIFNDTITVSTNFFVRWYANKPLFWGSIAGVVVVAAAICIIIAYKRKKKEDND